jgi:hypothetical protein
MNKQTRNIIISIFVILAIITIFIGTMLSQRVKMNEGYVTGNTAGNLNNNGLFCERNGVVYFSNLYDSGCLYSMSSDGSNVKKLTSSSVTSINADDHYLYYFLDSYNSGQGLESVQRTYGIYRSDLNGKHTQCLKRGNAITLQLCGNYLYYQNFDNHNTNGTELFKMKIDKSEDKRITDYLVNPASCVDGIIYFNGTRDNHYLYALNTANDSISTVWEENVFNPVYHNGYFYFMDASANYRLCRYSPSANVVEVLTNERIDLFNVYDNYIYYQTNSETDPALKRMYTDGSNVETVVNGIYKNINITSSYVYFTAFESDTPMYRTPTYGSVYVTSFDEASQAALKNLKK